MRDKLRALIAQLNSYFCEALGADIKCRNSRTFGSQPNCSSAANPTCSTGDQCNFAIKSLHQTAYASV